MAFFDMVLIGVGLAADAFAAAVVRGLRIGRLRGAYRYRKSLGEIPVRFLNSREKWQGSV